MSSPMERNNDPGFDDDRDSLVGVSAKSSLTESGTVVAIQGEFALVEVAPKNGCSGCAQSGGCGTSALSTLFVARHNKPIRVENPLGVEVGNLVDLSMDESRLVKHSFMAYGLPLIGLLVFSVLAQKLLFISGIPVSAAEKFADVSAIFGGLFGLFAGWWVTKRFYRPVLPEITRIHNASQTLDDAQMRDV
ncbi:SoxR reducing system RseC family protein [Thiomicrorhabdus xiamenensis]|uniref:SoxR reducing system RseC family protein n=1 Tax=Thiomicrorhabdus xiamenensis TaxID=2739063 RepID=A0A7D4NQP3_9GAMM|nr:SoxR reducing system RseC family protein [Thiomicrorhabdus xiamenensis]QKI88997.1 SoxR reducing system RseC family protein [Thiomicrorhabdus xiamenensis]